MAGQLDPYMHGHCSYVFDEGSQELGKHQYLGQWLSDMGPESCGNLVEMHTFVLNPRPTDSGTLNQESVF